MPKFIPRLIRPHDRQQTQPLTRHISTESRPIRARARFEEKHPPQPWTVVAAKWLAVICLLAIIIVVWRVAPDQIKNTLVPGWYLPLLGLVGGLVFFTAFSWINHLRRSMLLTVLLTIFCFAQLSGSLNWWLVGFLAIPLLLLEFVLTITREK